MEVNSNNNHDYVETEFYKFLAEFIGSNNSQNNQNFVLADKSPKDVLFFVDTKINYFFDNLITRIQEIQEFNFVNSLKIVI